MFKVKQMVTSLESEILECLKSKGEIVTYTVAADLFYEGQIPVVAYLVLDGHIHFLKGRTIKETITGGNLVGAKELMSNTHAIMSAQIMPKTQVCFLSKSDIHEILEEENELAEQLDQIINF